ncbi:unnamed protein product [Urochloa decumbens]|uniref:Peptidase A1 domain-containing protein n=1 Tax=Urochloa decumbens TaxID=240449 RepID=A0ABC9GDJ3_9POAL
MMGTTSLLCLALLCSSMAFTACVAAGLRLELTHVDANRTVEERMRRAMARTRQHRLASTDAVAAPIHWMKTQYIAEYVIGDPPQRAEAIIDTGSNLVWTQCSGCSSSSTGCFDQNLPYYDPSQSSTGLAVSCGDAACSLGSETQCASDGETCAVSTSYGAGDIAGVLGTETFTFGSSEKVTGLDFGCILATALTRGSLDGASGIIGLGRGGLSLVSQLGETKFSYCLTRYDTDTVDQSHLFVGGSSAGLSPSSGAPVTSAPFLQNPDEDPYSTFYYLPLTGVAVGDTTLDVPASAFALRQGSSGQWAGTIIDSGSPFTTLVDVAYQALRDELARQLSGSLVQPPEDGLDLCVARGKVVPPPLVLHFGSGGGDLMVPSENYWGPVDDATCMMVFRSPSESTTIGNYMQQNMHLLYDLGNNVLSFQTADCSSM